MCSRFIKYLTFSQLAFNPDHDPEVEDLLEKFDWIIIPVLNPDGYVYSHLNVSFLLFKSLIKIFVFSKTPKTWLYATVYCWKLQSEVGRDSEVIRGHKKIQKVTCYIIFCRA